MGVLPEKEYTYFTTVTGMCRQCRQLVPARIAFYEDEVWQENLCNRCGTRKALIAGDKRWYLEQMAELRPDHSPLPSSRQRPPQSKGCPHDCGPCAWHASPCQLPVVSITNACNLRCPICFTYNRTDSIYHMPLDEFQRTVDWVVAAAGQVDLINITGGEPALHPELFDILKACRRPEIGRVTLNTNGIIAAADPAFCRRLADEQVCVVLSFNTFDPQVSRRLHGSDLVATKLKAIENLSKAGVRLTLLNVMIRGQNENQASRLLELMRSHDNILSLTIQTMTYTGQGGGAFPQQPHIPVDAAVNILCSNLDGQIQPADFIGRPSAHPLCYQIGYFFKLDDKLLPFTQVLTRDELAERLASSYLLRTDDDSLFFNDVVNRLFSRSRTDLLPSFKKLLKKLFPAEGKLTHFERQRMAESFVRTVYIHAHMDEDTFDCSRAMLCPDQVPSAPGRLIPACTYNLFYRQQDPRYYA